MEELTKQMANLMQNEDKSIHEILYALISAIDEASELWCEEHKIGVSVVQRKLEKLADACEIFDF